MTALAQLAALLFVFTGLAKPAPKHPAAYAMAGPFATLDAYCLSAYGAVSQDPGSYCDPAGTVRSLVSGPTTLGKTWAPYLAARLVRTASESGDGGLAFRLAVETTSGWFVSSELGAPEAAVEVDDFSLRQVPGEAPTISLRFATAEDGSHECHVSASVDALGRMTYALD